MASVVPKYFRAVLSVTATVLGSFSAVCVLPAMAGSVKTLKKVESAWATLNSLMNWLPFFTSLLPLELYILV